MNGYSRSHNKQEYLYGKEHIGKNDAVQYNTPQEGHVEEFNAYWNAFPLRIAIDVNT